MTACDGHGWTTPQASEPRLSLGSFDGFLFRIVLPTFFPSITWLLISFRFRFRSASALTTKRKVVDWEDEIAVDIFAVLSFPSSRGLESACGCSN